MHIPLAYSIPQAQAKYLNEASAWYDFGVLGRTNKFTLDFVANLVISKSVHSQNKQISFFFRFFFAFCDFNSHFFRNFGADFCNLLSAYADGRVLQCTKTEISTPNRVR